MTSTKHFPVSYFPDHLKLCRKWGIRGIAEDFSDSKRWSTGSLSEALRSSSLMLPHLGSCGDQRRMAATHLRDHLVEGGHDVGALCLLVVSEDPR